MLEICVIYDFSIPNTRLWFRCVIGIALFILDQSYYFNNINSASQLAYCAA